MTPATIQSTTFCLPTCYPKIQIENIQNQSFACCFMHVGVKLGLSTTTETSNFTSVHLVGLFPVVFYVPLLIIETDTIVSPVSSKLSILVNELTGCYCDHTGHLQNIFQLPMQLLCSGFHWRPDTLWDENICSNEFVPHNLVRNV